MNHFDKGCPAPELLSQAATEGLSPALQKHLRGCEACRALYDEERELASMLQDLPRAEPSPAAHDEARRALLAAAEAEGAREAVPARPVRRPWRWAVALAAAVLLGVVSVAWWRAGAPAPSAPSTPHRGEIYAVDEARFFHLGDPGDEIVRLTEGTITVEVEHLKPGERFRVVTEDAEVEVRGTIFEVTASAGKLVGVRVLRGAVEVRPAKAPAQLLQPGQRWDEPAPAPAPESQPASVPASAPVSVTMVAPVTSPQESKEEEGPSTLQPKALPAPAPAPEAPGEARYQEGFAALRAGEYSKAAAAFEVVARDTSSELAEDAAFWRAVSLARAKQRAEASAALDAFLAKYPGSSRAPEAGLLLGQQLLALGEREAARARFTAVRDNAPEAIRQRAQAALDALDAPTPVIP